MGRKPIADSAKKNQLHILLTDDERAALDAAASAAGKPTSTWARDLLLEHAASVKLAPAKKSTKKKPKPA